MPAIQVARTDTFEAQRQKINQIGQQIFNVTAGGSDLSTGNLKLGDGSIGAPSLAFVNDSSLGLFRSAPGTIRYVYSLKKLIDISENSTSFYRDVVLQQSLINNTGLSVLNNGSNYDPGTYNGVSLLGGTGSGATANITITPFGGSVTNDGYGYSFGTYNGIPLSGGTGTGVTVSFSVPTISGEIQDPGLGYLPGLYQNVPLTNVSGSGSGATANLEIVGDVVYNGTITNAGSGYSDLTGEILNVFNEPFATFTVTITPNPSSPPDNLFVINGVTQQTLTLVKGRTYRFDLSSADLSQHPFSFQDLSEAPLSSENYVVQVSGQAGNAGAFLDLIIKDTAPNESFVYFCEVHDGMGGTVNITTGTPQNFGSGATATVSSVGGVITSFVITGGSGYAAGNTLQLSPNDAGPGTSFLYTLNSLSYSGEVISCIITDSGNGYNQNDVLSVADSSVGSGGGSGFEFLIQSRPSRITQLVFDSKGSGYSVGDVLSLNQTISNVSVVLKGSVVDVATTLSTTSTQITVASTAGILEGMAVANGPDDTGFVAPNTTVLSIDSPTTLTLSDLPIVDGAALLTFNSPGTRTEFTVADASGIIIGSTVSKTSGVGDIGPETTVVSVDYDTNVVTINSDPTAPGSAVLSFTPPYGVGSSPFQYTISTVGTLESITVSDQGNGYEVGDTLSVNSEDLTSPINIEVTNKTLVKLTFTTSVSSSVFTIGDTIEPSSNPGELYNVWYIKSTNSFVDYILVDSFSVSSGDLIFKTGVPGTQYTVDTVENTFRWFLNGEASPDLTLYVGNTYNFSATDTSNNGHSFALSEIEDGSNYKVENIAATAVTGSSVITLSDTTGILSGMDISVTDGDVQLVAGSTVVSIDSSTQITISSPVFVGGSSNLSFSGAEFLDGVSKVSSVLTIKITDSTPSTLYYYCSSGAGHENEGGYAGERALLTIDPNNPKVFGSGISLSVAVVDISDVIKFDNGAGSVTVSNSLTASTINSSTISNTGTITSQDVSVSGTLQTSSIQSNNINVTTNQITFSGNILVSNTISIAASSGNITSSGVIKTTSAFNSNDKLSISDSTISTTSGNDITLLPSTGRLVDVNSNTALVLPVGSTNDRPPLGVAKNGSVRFNTDTGQYEGYNASTLSWSSLGGVRDLDGNTYISAEQTTGSNDNRLWFYNDGSNTVRFTATYLEFISNKKIRSLNTSAPSYSTYTSSTPVTTGSYLKYKHDIYIVVSDGTTAGSGSEPNNTTGNPFVNGTATLQYFTTAVAPLTFEEISEIRIGPTKSVPMLFEGDLRITKNTIATDLTDLTFKPNTGRRIICDAKTHLQIPSGTDGEKSSGTAKNGSIRYNTTNQVYEGFSESTNTWGSLGGVKDVDQNTYIIPETAPGANENILYFYNDNVNTINVSTQAVDFLNIDTITSSISNSLEISASSITLDNASTTIDNTGSSTFISTTKNNLDLGLSSGLSNDVLLRLDDQGDIFYNTGFGTGSQSLVRIFDKELSSIELSRYRISTSRSTLTKGGTENGSSVIYSPSIETSAKVEFVAHNLTTGNKQVVEFSVIDKGSDIFYTEIGTVETGIKLISYTLDFNVNGSVRINYSLSSSITTGNVVDITVVSNVIKK